MLSAITLRDWFVFGPELDTEYMLTGGTIFTDNRAFIEFQLTMEDINAIKIDTRLCTDGTTCWLRFSSDFIADMAGNQIQEVVTQSPLEFL